MRLPKRGEKGFTLIELLIVVAILGVLAAVVIPNVTRFVGAGEEEAAETELHNIQLAVTSMMLENGITRIPNPLAINDLLVGEQTNLMGVDPVLGGGFPDNTSNATDGDKLTDPEGYTYDFAVDKVGYVLYGHDINAKDDPDTDDTIRVNYVTVATTAYYYTCQADGTVQQWDVNGAPLSW